MRIPCVSRRLVLALLLTGCAQEADKSAPPPDRPQATDSAPSDAAAAPQAAPKLAPAPSAAEPLLTPPQTAQALPRAPHRQPYTTIRVFYGTNRKPTADPRPAQAFSTEPGPLSFGFCDISIPPDHAPGELESPRLWRFEFREDPHKHVVLLAVHPASGPEFITELQRAVWASIEWRDESTIIGGEAIVFVHGFNNSFEDAARRTAQIARDLKFRGAPVMYSWPSQGSGTLRGYQEDVRRAALSEPHFLNFLAGLARESGARRIHVIAHSMGNRLVAETLRKLSWPCSTGQLPRLNQVVLTAPDIDAEYFKAAIAPRIVQTAERITIYTSSRDVALKASSFANRAGQHRLGEAGDELSTFPEFDNIEVVDASTVDTGLFSLHHSYHADNPSVLSDIQQVLLGEEPINRGLQSLLGTLAWKIRAVRESLRQAGQTVVQ